MIFLYIFITILLLLYLWFQHMFAYWTRRGITGPKPVFPFGNLKNVIMGREHFFQPYIDCYYVYKKLPLVGMYSFYEPVVSINDVDLAKRIMIDDFKYFESHGIFSGGAGDPFAGHLFNLHGEPWRSLRHKLSSAFSPSKIKTMYPLVEDIANQAFLYAESHYLNNEAVNFSEFYERYAMEIVGSVGFGIACKGFKNSKSEFYLWGHEYFEPTSLYWLIIRAVAFFMPTFFDKLKINRINPNMTSFFPNLVQESVEFRQKHSFKRNDYLQTLIDLKQNALITDLDIKSNAMLYLFAGYETSATTGQFAAYQLALNPRVQDRVRTEITEVLAKHRGELTYEAQNEMTYMNMVLNETMRMHPPMRALFRRCTKDYQIPKTNIQIEKGIQVLVPVHAMQMDPGIFPNPETFDPERFSPENKEKMHPCHWMPFGEGPRKCLGLRQGYIQTKLALVKLLQKYELLLDKRTLVPTKMKTSSLGCAAEGGIWIQLRKLSE